jgi:hypothetical protein
MGPYKDFPITDIKRCKSAIFQTWLSFLFSEEFFQFFHHPASIAMISEFFTTVNVIYAVASHILQLSNSLF